jgi:ubiquinone biosynthesis protein UbiJ
MATQSPFSFLDGLFDRLAAGPQPPQWLVHEVQQRMVLFLNHVLMQEKPEAMERLVRQRGRVARVQWRSYSMALLVTPAGLFNLAPRARRPICSCTSRKPLPWRWPALRCAATSPAIRIEGDVQLAAEINWLVDHVRWDLEEDWPA